MANAPRINVLGISGSLRRGSFNTSVLREAARLAPADMAIELADISEIPLYNEDTYAQGFPLRSSVCVNRSVPPMRC